MAVERKKEKQKTPEEIAKEQTAGKEPTGSEEESKPKAQAGKKEATAAKSKGRGTAKPAAKTASSKAKPARPDASAPAKGAKAEATKSEGEPTKASSAAAKPKQEAAKPKPEAAKPAARRPRAPGRRRTPRAEEERRAPERPLVRARAKYVRCSARKVRLVMEHIRGKPIDEARAVLRHTRRSVARDVERLLDSAVANAENNHELVGDDLLVKDAYADEGPTLKRFRPRALGRATRIRKRTSHLTLTLAPKD